MIKFITVRPDGSIGLGFGLTEENIRLLKEGKPIKVDLGEYGIHAAVMILYGETEADVMATLKPFIGKDTKIHGLPNDG